MAGDPVQRPVVGCRADAIEAGLSEIRPAWAETVTKQHEQAEDDVRMYGRFELNLDTRIPIEPAA